MPDGAAAGSGQRTDQFLAIEQIAHELADRLARLNSEADRYSSAAGRLDEAVDAVRALAGRTRDLGDQTAKALDAIVSIGGPEMVRQLAGIEVQQREALSALSGELTQCVSRIAAVQDALERQEDFLTDLRAADEERAAEFDALRQAATKQQASLEDLSARTGRATTFAALAALFALLAGAITVLRG